MAKKNLAACKARAAELRLTNMFEPDQRMLLDLERTREVAEYYHQHGKLPTSSNPGRPRQLSNWLSHKSWAKAMPGAYWNHKFYQECQVLADKLGVRQMFDLRGKSKSRKRT